MMIQLKPSFVLALTLLVAACGEAPKGTGVRRDNLPPAERQRRADQGEVAYASTFPQLVDHQNTAAQASTFAQRYFLDSTHAKTATSPVLIWICAEGPCSADQMKGALEVHATALGAHMLALEHRYYGKSFPVTNLATENLRFLTVEQALADLGRFIEFMRDVEGLKGKWASFGGSYSGALSAYLRATRPDLIATAIASSAPVKAKEAFEDYDAHVAQVLGTDCAAAARKMIQDVDTIMETDPVAFAALRKSFGVGDEAADKNYFGTLFSYPLANMAQYGSPTKEALCDAMQSAKPAEAFAGVTLADTGAVALARPLSLALLANDGSDPSNTELPNEDVFGGRSWLYQMCKQFGFFPVAHHDRSVSVYSKYQTLEYYRGICTTLFGVTDAPATNALNQKHYSKLASGEASRVLYTNGTIDPWSTLSFTQSAPKGSEAYVIEGGRHCDDMYAPTDYDSESLKGARAKIGSFLATWLK